MKTTTEYAAKLEALKAHLIENEGFNAEEVDEGLTYEKQWETFCIGGYEYLVYTDEEADKAAREEILESLWAFRPSFILEHTAFYKTSSVEEDDAFEDALKDLQGRICEGANPIVKALIVDLDQFVQNAIDADGRGQFISHYDGEEVESGDFYLYRIN